nr:NAD(+) diphosphatase [Rubellimicrobium sp. CFH 75288]
MRTDPEALSRLARRTGARRLALAETGDALAHEVGGVVRPILEEGARPEDIFLGLLDDEGLWTGLATDPPPEARPLDLRTVLATLDPAHAECAALARALWTWHGRHGFCAACGAPSRIVAAGWRRDCPACGAQHFPRTDPVVIALVLSGNAVLLGRSPGWPEGMHSLLAGYMEPGETVEAAVRREVAEEAGVPVGRVRYLASQPWPFPASLMLGCRAEATGRALAPDPAEIESVLWVGRERLLSVFMGRDAALRAPRPGSIASFLLREWLAGRIGSDQG